MRILFIDDNTTVCKTIEALLRKYDYLKEGDILINKTTTLIDKEELLNLLSECELIICDFDLGANCPNGIEFFNDFSDYIIDKKKILLTGNNSYILESIMEMRTDIEYITKEDLHLNELEGIHKLGNIIKVLKK